MRYRYSTRYSERAGALGGGLKVSQVEVLVRNECEKMVGRHAGRGVLCPQEVLCEHHELVADVFYQAYVGGVPGHQVKNHSRHGALGKIEFHQLLGEEVAGVAVGDERHHGKDDFEELGPVRPPVRIQAPRNRSDTDPAASAVEQSISLVNRDVGPLDVEAELHHVAVGHDIFLAFDADFAAGFCLSHGSGLDEVIEGNHFSFDEAALEV